MGTRRYTVFRTWKNRYSNSFQREGSDSVMDAIDFVDAHMLPFFSTKATTGEYKRARSDKPSSHSSPGNKAWPIVLTDLNWFVNNCGGKKIYLSEVSVVIPLRSTGLIFDLKQNGWPSTTYPGVEPNSPDAVADVQNEKVSKSSAFEKHKVTSRSQLYYKLLDDNCTYLKGVAGGGVGWFAHIYSDDQEPGYGIYDYDGNLKFPFAPKTSC